MSPLLQYHNENEHLSIGFSSGQNADLTPVRWFLTTANNAYISHVICCFIPLVPKLKFRQYAHFVKCETEFPYDMWHKRNQELILQLSTTVSFPQLII